MSYDNYSLAKNAFVGTMSAQEQNLKSTPPERTWTRRPIWIGTYLAIKHIASLPRKNFRTSDRVSDILVLSCLVCALLLIFIPSTLLKLPVVLVIDTVFITVVLYFVMKRMGIILTLPDRQAVLVGDIIVGALLLGMLISINVILFILLAEPPA